MAGDSLIDMIKDDLVAELIAIDSYCDIIQHFIEQDLSTDRLSKGYWLWKCNMLMN
ncbi:MAG: hypothetical protein HY272_07710 [Gammaproteobacteria bacterium]|nr:hypothetical protein [Gammaproteobacteria bacterium]